MRILVVYLTVLYVALCTRLHSLTLNDIADMPVDAIKPALTVAKKVAMSKLGLSKSRTIGSYFGK